MTLQTRPHRLPRCREKFSSQGGADYSEVPAGNTFHRRRSSSIPIVRTTARRCPVWEFAVLPGLVREVQPDVVHGPDFTLPWQSACPAAVTLHDPVPWEAPEDLSWRARVWYRWRAPQAAASARLVVSVNVP